MPKPAAPLRSPRPTQIPSKRHKHATDSKSKKKSTSTGQPVIKPFLSEEFIVDSSQDEDLPDAPTESRPSSRLKLGSVKKSKQLNGTTPIKSAQVNSPPSSSSDSETSSAASTSSEDASTPDDSPRNLSTSNAKENGAKEVSSTGSESSEGEDDDESDSSEEGDQEHTMSSSANHPASLPPKQAGASLEIALRPPKAYKPPPGYKDASGQDPWHKAKLFDADQLAGKQLWLISVPTPINLEDLEALSAEQLNGTRPLVSSGGNDYALHADQQAVASNYSVMLPNDKHYRPLPLQFTGIFSVRNSISLPISSHTVQPEAAQLPAKRQQPAGLRTRWHPPGCRQLSEDVDAVNGQPPSVTSPNKKRKRDAEHKEKKRKEKGDAVYPSTGNARAAHVTATSNGLASTLEPASILSLTNGDATKVKKRKKPKVNSGVDGETDRSMNLMEKAASPDMPLSKTASASKAGDPEDTEANQLKTKRKKKSCDYGVSGRDGRIGVEEANGIEGGVDRAEAKKKKKKKDKDKLAVTT